MKLPRLPLRALPGAADRPSLLVRRRRLLLETRMMLAAKVVLVLGAAVTIYFAATTATATLMPGLLFLVCLCLFLVTDIVAGNVYASLQEVEEDLDHLEAVSRIEGRA